MNAWDEREKRWDEIAADRETFVRMYGQMLVEKRVNSLIDHREVIQMSFDRAAALISYTPWYVRFFKATRRFISIRLAKLKQRLRF